MILIDNSIGENKKSKKKVKNVSRIKLDKKEMLAFEKHLKNWWNDFT